MTRGATLAGIVCCVTVIQLFARVPREGPQPASASMQTSIAAPQAEALGGLRFAISPDGKRLAYIGVLNGVTKVWIRDLDSSEEWALDTTDGAANVFWAPDSLRLAFFTADKLRTIDPAGGPPAVIADVEGAGSGGSWSADGTILFSPRRNGPLQRVSSKGGPAIPVTALDASRNELSHRDPQFLPDGRHFVYTVRSADADKSGVFLGSLADAAPRLLLDKPGVARFAEPGFLLFLQNGVLRARAFDLDILAFKGADLVPTGGRSFDNFSVSNTGTLVVSSEENEFGENQITWFNREGAELAKSGRPGVNLIVNLAPDEKRMAVTRKDPNTGAWRTWLRDLATDTDSPLRENPGIYDTDPVWCSNQHLFFTAYLDGHTGLLQIDLTTGRADAVSAPPLTRNAYASDCSRDGRYGLMHSDNSKVYALPLDGGQPLFLRQGLRSIDQMQFSPDAHWIVYSANDSGNFEVLVMPFPNSDPPIQVSLNGGIQPRWRKDARELFYIDYEGWMTSVAVRPGSPITFGVPVRLFKTRLARHWEVEQYDVTSDGQRFVLLVPTHEAPPPAFQVVPNWQAATDRPPGF